MLLPAERGFRFSHELIARSIYAGISPARRRTMHRRVAELLEQDTALEPERAADLAHHAAQSGDAGAGGARDGLGRDACACASSPTTRRWRSRAKACSGSSSSPARRSASA